jgi:hypothetical protein
MKNLAGKAAIVTGTGCLLVGHPNPAPAEESGAS